MSAKFIATIAAAAVAITSVNVTPAAATDDDLLKRWLLGAATMVVIGNALHEARNAEAPSPRVTHQNPRPRVVHQPRHTPHHANPRPHKPRGAHVLPRRCVRYVPLPSGREYRTLGAKCLKRHFDHAHRLPKVCRESVKMRGKWRSTYKIRCLRDKGYRLARH